MECFILCIILILFSKRYFSQMDLLENVPYCMILLASIYLCIQILGFVLLFENDENLVNSNELSVNNEEIPEEKNSLDVR